MPGNLPNLPPLSVIVSWPAPNYTDPIRRTWMPLYAGVLQTISTVMVGMRLWLRASKRAGVIGLDDALLIPAYVFATLFTALVILGSEYYGMDRHVWDVPLPLFERTTLIAWLAEVAFFIGTCCTKVSVLLFYRRLVEGSYNPKWKIANMAAIVFTTCYGVAFILTLIFNCSPTESYWKAYSVTYSKHYHCADTRALNLLSGVLSSISDLYSVLLPMALVSHLNTNRRTKIALNMIFSLGLIVAVAGAVRTYYITRLGYTYDITWVGFATFVWSDLEVHLALICACAPTLRAFFRRYLSDPVLQRGNAASSVNQNDVRVAGYDSTSGATARAFAHMNLSELDLEDLKGAEDRNTIEIKRTVEMKSERES